MLNRSEQNRCREINIATCDASSLVDLRDISIDTTKSVRERINSYMNQVRNPYLFKVDDIIIKVNYGRGKTFSEALVTVLLTG